MKKIFTLLFFVFMYQAGFSQWVNLDSLSSVRCAFSAFSIGDTGYAVAGGGSQGYVGTAYIYIQSSNTWTQIANYPQGGNGNSVTGFAIGDTGYTGLGAASGYYFSDYFYKYDPHTNTWTQIANLPGPGRAGAVSFVINGTAYVGGGLDGYNNNPLNDFYSYNPSTGWDTIAPCPAHGVSFQSTAFVVNGKGYVGTGGQQVGAGTTNYVPVADFWSYDPSTNTWDSVAPFGGGVRMGCFSYGVCNKGYVGAGVTDAGQSQFQDDFWEYDPSNGPLGTWTQLTNFGGTVRSCSHAFVIGDNGYVCGGFYNTSNATGGALWEYLPTDTPAFSANNAVCTGGSITFTDTSTYAPTNRVWQFPGGTPGTDTAKTVIVQYDTVGTYNVVLTAWSACGDSGSMTFTNYVTVTQGPSVSVTPDSPSVCNGQSIVLTASGGSSYQWVGTTDTSAAITVNPSADTTYELRVSIGSCTTDTFISVKENNAPPLYIQPSSTSICPGTGIVLTVPVSGSDYTWSPVLTLSSSTGDSVTAKPSTQTIYTVTGIDSLGCSVAASDTISLSSAPNKPTISTYQNDLVSSATQGNQWLRNDTVITGATNQTYTVTIGGYYQVIASNPANGCSTESDSSFATGINQLSVESGQVTVYPNPTAGEINVNISSSAIDVSDWNLQIIDVLGRTVYTKQSLNYSNAIDLSRLSGGVYFISVMNKTGRVVVPLVKQ